MEVKEDLFQLVERKYEEIESIQAQIRYLENRMMEIDKLIGMDNVMDAETFLQQMKDEPIENVEDIQTIFSRNNPEQPLVKLKYDGKKLEIFFPYPEKLGLKQQSSIYIEHVLQPLFPLKEKETELEVVIDKQNDLGYISKILINNLYNIENIDEVYKVFQNLLEYVK